ncbi:MAG: hypothetical protein JST49_08445, partial [Bacteroidetes bacterium]|nr:hypothetical protein [Bacteroidota bacterium]
MEPVIDRVAQIVETGLNKASAEVEKGKKQLDDYWKAQPAETKKIAGDAYKEINGKYEDLEKQVEDKQQGLITALTDAYVNTVGGLQEKFDTIRSQSMGLLGMALDYVGGVIKVILQMKDMLLGTFSRVSHVVEDIIAHPIEFLGNMVEAVGTGFRNFAVNSLQHLKTGFFE